jgi:hypothetical protein
MDSVLRVVEGDEVAVDEVNLVVAVETDPAGDLEAELTVEVVAGLEVEELAGDTDIEGVAVVVFAVVEVEVVEMEVDPAGDLLAELGTDNDGADWLLIELVVDEAGLAGDEAVEEAEAAADFVETDPAGDRFAIGEVVVVEIETVGDAVVVAFAGVDEDVVGAEVTETLGERFAEDPFVAGDKELDPLETLADVV